MSQKHKTHGRRSFLKTGALAVTAIPAAVALGAATRDARAAGLPHLSESDPQATALKYKDDATKSQRPSNDEFCHNCLNFEGKSGAAWGPCKVFPGKDVNRDGWCAAWVKKTA